MPVTRKVLISTRELLARVTRNAADYNEALAREVEKWAHVFVPKRTGTLDSTIKTVTHQDGSASVVAGGPAAPYAPNVEFGTVHQPAQPYMMPAAEKVKHGQARRVARRRKFYRRG